MDCNAHRHPPTVFRCSRSDDERSGADRIENALRAADIDLQSIDLIIIATSTPDFVLPSTACALQRKLGLRNHCIAFDLQAACTGFVYALTIADQFIRARACQTALVV